MFRYQRIAAAAVAVGVITVLTGCAGTRATETSSAHDADIAAAKDSYDKLVADIYGSPVQRIAGEERGWLLTQAAISDCARSAGITYPVGPFNAMASLNQKVAPGDLIGFAPIGTTMGVGEFKQRWAAKGGPEQENNPVYLAIKTDAERDTYMKKIQDCQSSATPHEAAYRAPKTELLSSKFIGALAKIMQQATPDAKETYVSCMRIAGVPVESFSDLANQVAMAYPPIIYDKPKDATADPGWAKAAAFEAKASQADASCRTDIVATAMAAALPTLTTFAAENRAELDANVAQWTALESEVAALRTRVTKN